jgi:hypothetical protein
MPSSSLPEKFLKYTNRNRNKATRYPSINKIRKRRHAIDPFWKSDNTVSNAIEQTGSRLSAATRYYAERVGNSAQKYAKRYSTNARKAGIDFNKRLLDGRNRAIARAKDLGEDLIEDLREGLYQPKIPLKLITPFHKLFDLINGRAEPVKRIKWTAYSKALEKFVRKFNKPTTQVINETVINNVITLFDEELFMGHPSPVDNIIEGFFIDDNAHKNVDSLVILLERLFPEIVKEAKEYMENVAVKSSGEPGDGWLKAVQKTREQIDATAKIRAVRLDLDQNKELQMEYLEGETFANNHPLFMEKIFRMTELIKTAIVIINDYKNDTGKSDDDTGIYYLYGDYVIPLVEKYPIIYAQLSKKEQREFEMAYKFLNPPATSWFPFLSSRTGSSRRKSKAKKSKSKKPNPKKRSKRKKRTYRKRF